MSELAIGQDYKPQMNPEFVRRTRERRRREAQAEAERKSRDRLEMRSVKELEKRADERFQKLLGTMRARHDLSAEIGLGNRIPVQEIIAAVAQKHLLSAGEVLSKTRCREVVAARFEAIAEIRRLRPELTLTAIGRHLNRDHTSIIHALRKMGLRPE